MKNRYLMLAALMVLVGIFSTPQAESRTRNQIIVESESIMLGDFFDNAGAQSNVVLGPSPLPGKQIVYRVSYLRSLARQYNLPSPYLPGQKFVTVRRASETVAYSRLIETISDVILKTGLNDRFEIELSNRKADLIVAKGLSDDTQIGVVDFQFQRHDGRFLAVLEAPAGSSQAQQVSVYGRVQILKTVPVLGRGITKGDIVSALDIDWIELPERELRRNIVMSEEQLIGSEVKKSLRPGEPVSIRDLRTPLMVKKGKLVTVNYHYAGLALTLTGRALADGSMGATVPIMNLQSKRTVQAEIVSKDVVRVLSHGQVATAASN